MKFVKDEIFESLSTRATQFDAIVAAITAGNSGLKAEDVTAEMVISALQDGGDDEGGDNGGEQPVETTAAAPEEKINAEDLAARIATLEQTNADLTAQITNLNGNPAAPTAGGKTVEEPVAATTEEKDAFQALFNDDPKKTAENLRAAGLM